MTASKDAILAALSGLPTNVERVPFLRSAFAAACTQLASHMSTCCSPPKIVLEAVTFGTAQGHIGPNWKTACCVLFSTQSPPSQVLLHLEPGAVDAIVDASLGGDGTEVWNVPPRNSFSDVEMRISALFGAATARALEAAFAQADIDFPLHMEGVSQDQSELAFAAMDVMSFAATIGLSFGSRHCRIRILLQQKLVAELRKKTTLSQPATDADGERDREAGDAGQLDMRGDIGQATVQVTAILDERSIHLDQLAQLRKGDIVSLNATASSDVLLASSDISLFWCELGRKGSQLMLRVDLPVIPQHPLHGSARMT